MVAWQQWHWGGADALGRIGGARVLVALLPRLDRASESDGYLRVSVADAVFKIYWQLENRRRFILPGSA